MALPLKSGADLYNQQLIRAAIWNYSADGLDPSEYATGLIYFNTNPSSNMYQKLRFRTATSWKTIAFAEDLDVATNKDFVALKEKVDLLSGEVDTDSIISNMKEVSNFLAGFAEDAKLMDVLNNKLDKTGGTITSNSNTIITLKGGASNSYSVAYFMSGDTYRGYVGWGDRYGFGLYNFTQDAYLGIKDDGTPHYNGNTLIHSGNVGDYALKTDGSNAMQVGIKFNVFNIDLNVGLGDGIRLIDRSGANGPTGTTWWQTFSAVGSNGGFQFSTFPSHEKSLVFLRTCGNSESSWKDWREIAFTDSTVEAARKLVTDNGGGLVHFTSNVLFVGDTIYPNYQTHILGYDVVLRSGASATRGLILNSSGNVGIGTTNPQAKLHVSQDIIANGTIACKGVAAEGSAPVGTVDKWAGSIATGTKSQTYTHGLGTTDITVAIYEKNGNEWVQILTDVDIVNANTIRVTFGANTTVEHRIVVMG